MAGNLILLLGVIVPTVAMLVWVELDRRRMDREIDAAFDRCIKAAEAWEAGYEALKKQDGLSAAAPDEDRP